MRKAPKSKIVESRLLLQNPYAYLEGDGEYAATMAGATKPQKASSVGYQPTYRTPGGQNGDAPGTTPDFGHRTALRSKEAWRSGSSLPPDRLERVRRMVKATHARIWKNRNEIWPSGLPADPVDMLDPAEALTNLGFRFELVDSLGQYRSSGLNFEVAGIVDPENRKVSVSRRLPFNTRQFTTAHELGHALLHPDLRMHRDRPIDGTRSSVGTRDAFEEEADTFAALFLMPVNLLTRRFQERFLTVSFRLDEAALFALEPSDPEAVRNSCRDKRHLARMLARASSYNGRHFTSLAKQFHVSTEAMARRIEELALVDVE